MRRARLRVVVERLLLHLATVADDLLLARDLRGDPALQEPERVHVLQLGLRAERRGAGGPDRHVRVHPERALLHVHVGDAHAPERRLEQAAELRRPREGERRSGSVTISTSGVPPRLKSTTLVSRAVDAARAALVDQLRGVLLHVHAVDAHVAEMARRGKRDVVLADLVALRQVGIEVVLPVEDRPRRDLALEGHRDHQREVHRLRVRDRQRARVAEADRAGVRVRLVPERERAAAEHLRPRPQLDVDLDADDRLVIHRTGTPSKAIALLERMSRVQDPRLAEGGPGDLESHGQVLREAARDRDGRDAGQRHRHRVVVRAGTSRADPGCARRA